MKICLQARLLLAAALLAWVACDTASAQPREECEFVFVTVKQMPELLPDRETAMRQMQDRIEYPAAAKRKGIEDSVAVWFVVNKRGKVVQPRILGDSLGSGLDAEAIRVAKTLEFKPGKQRGERVCVRFSPLWVHFTLPRKK